MLGGPALYLLGTLLFKRTVSGKLPISHFIGILLLAALVPAAAFASPLMLATAALLVLVLVGIWETIELRRVRRG